MNLKVRQCLVVFDGEKIGWLRLSKPTAFCFLIFDFFYFSGIDFLIINMFIVHDLWTFLSSYIPLCFVNIIIIIIIIILMLSCEVD
jgi:hypothetical protein